MATAGKTLEWTFGDRLRKAREAAGLEQADMARKFGVSAAAVSKWERGAQPRNLFAVASKWAEETDVPLDWLLGTRAKGALLSTAA